MKKSLLIFVLLLLITAVSFPQLKKEEAAKFIRADDLKTYISFLASDKLKGRFAGTPENAIAAEYIAKRFSELGLKPFIEPRVPAKKKEAEEELKFEVSDEPPVPSPAEKYYQKFFLLKTQFDSVNTWLKVKSSFGSSTVETGFFLKKDFFISGKIDQNLSLNSKVVFLGFGIEKGEDGYSDYLTKEGKEIDIKDKVVLIVDSYPEEENPEGTYAKSRNVMYKNLRKKSELAFEKGALAVIAVASPIGNNPPFIVKNESMMHTFSKPNYSLPELGSEAAHPVIHIGNEVTNELFRTSGTTLKEIIRKINKEKKGNALELPGCEFNIKINMLIKSVPVVNVVGIIEGSDPVLKDEYVVVGAHFDHIGMGETGVMSKDNIGQIHNGADDNASGTAGVMEVAEAMSKVKPKRSVVFIAFNAEELGMMGSRYYAYQFPWRPVDKAVGMVNMDMIGRNESELLWIGGIFYSSDMKEVVENANKQAGTGFELLYNVGLLTFASDQGPFIRREVPAVFFFAGMHDDYHMPSDDVQKINFKKVERVAKLAFETANHIANTSDLPEFRPLGMDEKTVLVRESLEKQKRIRPKK
ncbi:MAG: M20/M25/M40 family metallo-hydrolase [Ignavibacteriaceae bacterium]|nr:M20/M25/M40 family metallo-hydrolase [Ignavibacteriaceae bacterium]